MILHTKISTSEVWTLMVWTSGLSIDLLKHWSTNYADLQINLIPFFNIQQWSNLAGITLIEGSRINPQV